ncbi:MAG TPA: aldo/keto reductase [Armatimonadota bacterium]|nr:aldo/keto reductase [Armatimonadota bacterium]
MANERQHPDDQVSIPADVNRRQLLRNAGLLGAGAILGDPLRANAGEAAAGERRNTGVVPQRPFGRTGVQVSIIGIGGHTLGEAKLESEAIRIVHEAMDAGVNFMDNAWEYHDGRAEEWMGKALKGRRDKVFLMTKVCTHGRDAQTAMQQLEQSLRRLQTDHLDLWQVHEVIYDNDPELHFKKGGVMEALRHLGERDRLPGRPPPEPGGSARLRPHARFGDAGAARAVRPLCLRWPLRAVQDLEAVRWASGTGAARFPAEG